MDGPITFRCPQTGADVDAFVQQPKGLSRFETVNCPACMRFHFIDGMTGAVLPPTLLGPANWTP
ncbi:hypothetical protein SSBR45G_63990 [Bradyrhizobium sp. SSBR45G]|nr:hypothetical protein SSBR45G_63990 [Bradyrhizobium sp. SSBR45G]GLH88897.1 hypothetical protein SSBR45R_63580 [Bradyrhizobium sp. SSBR45R]